MSTTTDEAAPDLEAIRRRPTLTVPEAGAALGIGRDAAYAAARYGDIPTIRIGRRLLVPTAQFLRLLEGDS